MSTRGSKHVVNNPETHLAYVKLEDYEKDVLRTELARPCVRAWYRNPPRGNPEHTLSVAYRFEGSGGRSILTSSCSTRWPGASSRRLSTRGDMAPSCPRKAQGHVRSREQVRQELCPYLVDRQGGRQVHLPGPEGPGDQRAHPRGRDDAESAVKCYRRYRRPYGAI